MTSALAHLQAQFQAAILSDDTSILQNLAAPPTGTAKAAFEVYENAYGLRLYEFLSQAFPALLKLAGDDAFAEIAQSYIEDNPSTHRNARYFASDLAAHMRQIKTFPRDWCEMAEFEQALEDAFDAEDAEAVTAADLATAAKRGVETLHFSLAPSIKLLRFFHNTTALWWALTTDEERPEAEEFVAAKPVLVFRVAEQSRYRLLGEPEYMLLQAAQQGLSFAQMVEMLAFQIGPAAAMKDAANYLQNWIATGMIARLG
jgi:hypothetical protein